MIEKKGEKTRLKAIRRLIYSPVWHIAITGLFRAFEIFDALVLLVNAAEEAGDGEEEPVEEEGRGNEDGVALALHDRLLVPEVLGGGAGVFLLASRPHLILPVDVGEEEEAEGHHGKERLQGAPYDGEEAPPEAAEAREGEEEQHDRLSPGRVAQHHPLQRHPDQRTIGSIRDRRETLD
ncbi:unnamed protein product [Musa hybrid cultivar]